ncbi:MAG: hypothetical protein AAGH15_26750 [Myxococcota bacterium]
MFGSAERTDYTAIGDEGCVEGRETGYLGESAREAWGDLGGAGAVPVENAGGAGSLDRHWREAAFGAELMTSIITPGDDANPLSVVTYRALEDLGYVLAETPDLDVFALPRAALREGRAPEGIVLEGDTLPGPRYELRPEGVRLLP